MTLSKRIKNISIDLYYRITAMPMLFALWIIILMWGFRIAEQRHRLSENRSKLNHVWVLSEQLEGQKREKQEKKLKKFEKDSLLLEKEVGEYEDKYLTKKEFLENSWQKMVDPHFGQNE